MAGEIVGVLCYRSGMNRQAISWVCVALLAAVLGGCSADGRSQAMMCGPTRLSKPDLDRKAIRGMTGTYKVDFNFEETLAVQKGYALHEPYSTAAEELVVLIEDRPGFVSLQHLLVVKHGEETHVIKHWRQDWRYQDSSMVRYQGGETWRQIDVAREERRGAWVQTVYNADDSPRYAAVGRWEHDGFGVSTWRASPSPRPVPLRESQLKDKYDVLISEHALVVNDTGWLHMQQNKKLDTTAGGDGQVLAIEHGMNRYRAIPDKGFDKAHTYWQSTARFWEQVRYAWADALEQHDTITLADKWKGDPMFSHLFGLADEYWQAEDVSAARPRIDEVLRAFIQASDKP